MTDAPNLLNDDGSASMATILMMSHHAFRRDIAGFAAALARLARGEGSAEALCEEWRYFHEALHGHHEMEDTRIFPGTRMHGALEPLVDRLMADHQRIDPLLGRGDRAFSELPETTAAAAVVAELTLLLEEHLALEEREIVPLLREAKGFPPPPTEEMAQVYAQGFAWSSHGVAPEVLRAVHAMLPESLTSRLRDARAAFVARFERVWGSAEGGAARTPVPESWAAACRAAREASSVGSS